MIVHSIYFDTLGHSAAEQNLEKYLPEYDPEIIYRTTTLSEIKANLKWKGKIISLFAYPVLNNYKYDIGFNRLRSELAYSLMVYLYFSKLDKSSADVFHFRTQSICLLVHTLFRNLKVVITIDMTTKQLIQLRPHNKWFYLPITWLERKVFNSDVKTCCYSRTTANAVISGYQVAKHKVTCIHPAVKKDFFEIKRSFDTGNKPIILFVGNDFFRKGGDLLVEVFQKSFRNSAELWIVSNDPVISGSKNTDNIRYFNNIKPNTSELINLFAQADIFVLPTREEAYGIVFSEAMAAGLPCIGTNTMAIPELIQDGETGYLIAINDKVDLENKLSLLIENKLLIKKMSEMSISRAKINFTLDVFLNKYFQAFSG